MGTFLDTKSSSSTVGQWADTHRVSTTVRTFNSAIGSPDTSLLTGSLAFLAQAETCDVLDAWHITGNLPPELEILSTCAQLNPLPYADLASTGIIPDRWRTQYPVAAMLCAQVTRGFDDARRRDITSLRIYLLSKALENTRAGLTLSPHIAEASKYLINFLEDRIKYPKGIEWVSELASANRHLPTYEIGIVEPAKSLKSHLVENKGLIKNWSAGEKFADSLQAIAERRPEKLAPLTVQVLPSELVTGSEEWQSALSDLNLPTQSDQVLCLSPTQTDDEDEEPTEMVIFEAPPTEEHRFRVGLGLQLETQAQRNRIPYAWDRLRPDEIESLFKTIDQWLDSPEHQLLGAISVLALATGSSIEVVCSMQLASSPIDSRWVLDLAVGRLIRPPSRPINRATAPQPTVTAGGDEERWVRPLADRQELQLSPRLLAPLITAQQQRASASLLGELWPLSAPPQKTFEHRCALTPGLERVTQGMLKSTADQLIFDWTQDTVLCRMLLTSDQAIRPSACSYSSWTLAQANQQIHALSSQNLTHPDDVSGTTNGLGSEIDPDDSQLRETLESASKRLEQLLSSSGGLKSPDWHDTHNAITIYCVVLLLAYTGARPTRSVFETLDDFDLEKNRLFIDDKVIRDSTTDRWGRIVPLPEQACALMAQLYLPYLHWLKEKLARHSSGSSDFNNLSIAIDSQLTRNSKPAIPLFFLVSKSPTLRIMEVSESAIEHSTLFDWPLPANVFRHRMGTRLRQQPGGNDLAAAQLGHAEAGSDVYGAFSPRCWVDDEAAWRAALAQVLAPITITPLHLGNPGWDITNEKSDFARFLIAGEFGSTARSAARRATRELARGQAVKWIHEQVTRWLGQAQNPALHVTSQAFPDQLSELQIDFLSATDRWTELGRCMLFIDGRTPRPNHSIWYEAYEAFRSQIYRESYGQVSDRLVVKRKQIARFAFPRSNLHAERSVQSLRKSLDDAFSATTFSVRSLADHSLLTALDLALNGMVSDPLLLTLIVPKQRDRLRLHVRGTVVYLAVQSSREERDIPPFAWHCVPARSAYALLALMKSRGRELDSSMIPKSVEHFARDVERTLELEARSLKETQQLIHAVSDVVHQHNQLHLPGIVAAARRGMLPTWSLGSYSQARSLYGIYADELKDVLQSNVAFLERPTNTRTPTIAALTGERSAEERLLKEVRSALRDFERQAEGKNWSDRQRNVAATRIESALSSAIRPDAKGHVSTTIQLLVAWVLNMLREPGASGKQLRASSVRTYLSLFASGFLDFGRDVDLLEADEEEIEFFYTRVLARPVDARQRRSAHDGNGRRLDEQAVLGRLRDFHAFIESKYGAENPDWSALGVDLTSSRVSAEIITPSEYKAALHALCAPGSRFDRDAFLEGFLLVLGYRFGLRSGEAISMACGDWVSTKSGCVVLVSGTHKTPKSKAGRRQIPLLGRLSAHERYIIDGWIDYWNTLHLHSSRAPLFPSLTDTKKPTRVSEHRLRVIGALRLATGIDSVTFHHARHSFATLLSMRLLSPELIAETGGLSSAHLWGSEDVRRQLLGTTDITARSTWALAVALGHAHPETTLVSYCHFIHDWANSRVIQAEHHKFSVKRSLLTRDMVADLAPTNGRRGTPALKPISRKPTKAAVTAADVLEFLERLSHGVKPSRAGWLGELSEGQTRSLFEPLSRLNTIAASTTTDNLSEIETDAAVQSGSVLSHLLGSVPTSRWIELRELLKKSTLPNPSGASAVWQISGPRQLLFWSREHFDRVQDFLTAMTWPQEFFELFSPPAHAPHANKLADDYGWKLARTISNEGNKRIQIDLGCHPTGDPGHWSQVKDRVGLVVGPNHPDLRDRKELLLVWLAVHLRTAEQPARASTET